MATDLVLSWMEIPVNVHNSVMPGNSCKNFVRVFNSKRREWMFLPGYEPIVFMLRDAVGIVIAPLSYWPRRFEVFNNDADRLVQSPSGVDDHPTCVPKNRPSFTVLEWNIHVLITNLWSQGFTFLHQQINKSLLALWSMVLPLDKLSNTHKRKMTFPGQSI